MRALAFLSLLLVAGCSRAFVNVEPPSARILVNGRVVGVGRATIPTTKGSVAIVHAELAGFRHACAIVEHRRDQRLQLARAMPGDPPVPNDAAIREAWDTQRANLCADYAAGVKPATVIVTAGDLSSQPYEVLGEVQIDTTEESSSKAVAKDLFTRGWLVAALDPAVKGDTAKMYEALRTLALAEYGAKVDAIINVNVSEVDRDVFVRGIAVRFVGRENAEKARTVSERLEELDRLGASGMVTPEEYKARRKAILNEL